MVDLNCKVSIITVSYNSVNTIEQTIKSVLEQTYKNIEYILIDGASTDGTQQIIEKYSDSISYYISEKDDGLYYAMNKGIEKATGEIVGIINSDDWYDVNAVKSVVECFGQKDAELVYGRTVNVLENNIEEMGKISPIQEIWHGIPFQHPSVFIKKSVYNRFGVFDVNYLVASDDDLLLRFYSEGVRFEYLDKVIAYFRVGGFSSKCRKLGWDEKYKILMTYVNKCPYKDKEVPIIKEQYDWRCFSEYILEATGNLYKLLCEYFNEKVDNILIFGTGIWGKKCYQCLIDGGISVLYFADNNDLKWDTEFCGIRVINPNKLHNVEVYALIATKEYGKEIKEQLKAMKNKKLKYVMIEELKELFLNNRMMLGLNSCPPNENFTQI